jgi:hypothetical protein
LDFFSHFNESFDSPVYWAGTVLRLCAKKSLVKI